MQIRSLTIGVCALAIAVSACGEELKEATRFFDVEVDLEGAGAVVVDLPTSVVISGGSGSMLTLTGTISVFTSSAAQSQALADDLQVESDVSGGTLTVLIRPTGSGAGTPFPEATFGGTLDVTLPDDVDLSVIERGGTTRVSGVSGDIDVRSLGGVIVDDAERNVRVRAENGPVRVEAAARSGSTTDLWVGNGDVELRLPPRLDARVTAEAKIGTVYLSHPELPVRPATPYDVTVGGGGATVEVASNRGNIFLLAR